MTPVFGLCDHYMPRWAALDPVAAGMAGISGSFGAATAQAERYEAGEQ